MSLGYKEVGSGRYGCWYDKDGVKFCGMHMAEDFALNREDNIILPIGGIVIRVRDWYTVGVGYGKYVDVEFGQTIFGHHFIFRTSHYLDFKSYVKVGAILNQDDILGRGDNTGMSFGDHVHVEFLDEKGRRWDPEFIIEEINKLRKLTPMIKMWNRFKNQIAQSFGSPIFEGDETKAVSVRIVPYTDSKGKRKTKYYIVMMKDGIPKKKEVGFEEAMINFAGEWTAQKEVDLFDDFN